MLTREFNKQLELENDGQLSLFFVGAGSAFSKKYFNTNVLIVKGKTHLLIDCGTLCPYALESVYNTKITNIKNLFITHQHADHIGGVEELVLANKYISKSKVNIIATDKFRKKLWKESLKGGCHFSEAGRMTFNDYFVQFKPKKICGNPFEMYEIDFESINLKIFRTKHIASSSGLIKYSQPSYGLIIDNKVIFTGDTQFNKNQLDFLLNKYTDIETIFHDCDISGKAPAVHATFIQLNSLNADIKRRMFLCHYNSKCEEMDCKKEGFAGYAKPGIYYDFD